MRNQLTLACALATAVASLPALLSLTACGALGSGSAPDAGDPRSDQDGATLGSDVGASGAPAEASFDDGSGLRGGSCFNFIDDDGNGQLDCEDVSCASPLVNTACCVGSTATACCDAPEREAVSSDLCAMLPCLSLGGQGLTPRLGQVFASATLPQACGVPSEDGFAPIGDLVSHGTLTLPAVYDAAAAYLVIEGRIGVDEVSGEVAAAGFGLFAEQGLGAVTRPLVAVAASATSDDVRVIVGDRVVESRTLDAGGCARSRVYRLELSPEGTFVVSSREPGEVVGEWTVISSGDFDVSAHTRVAMFGQQPNPDPLPAAWVSGVSVTQSGCDLLAPARRADAVVTVAGTLNDVSGLAIFPVSEGSDTYEALVTSGDQLYSMSVQAARGGLVSSVSSDPFADNAQLVVAGDPFTRIEDVDVLLDAGIHHVFFAASLVGGQTSIAHTTWDPAARELDVPSIVVQPSTFGTDAVAVDGPSALSRSSGIVLAVRVRYADGRTELRLTSFAADAGLASEYVDVSARNADGITTDGLLHASQHATGDAFDRDEVADPQLFELDGVVRVLYAGRRGTRWSIGMVVASPDFTHFAPVGSAPILAPSGSGFDALGVSEPFLVRRAGTDWLYFAGTDGARRGIGLAAQPVVGGPS